MSVVGWLALFLLVVMLIRIMQPPARHGGMKPSRREPSPAKPPPKPSQAIRRRDICATCMVPPRFGQPS